MVTGNHQNDKSGRDINILCTNMSQKDTPLEFLTRCISK